MRILSLALIALSLTFASSPILAKAKEAKRKPSSSSARQVIEIRVLYGDKNTAFLIETIGGASSLTLFSNQESPRRRQIRVDDAEYIASKLRAAPAKREALDQCSRQWIYASVSNDGKKEYEATACLGDDTVTARTLLDVANLLSSVIMI